MWTTAGSRRLILLFVVVTFGSGTWPFSAVETMVVRRPLFDLYRRGPSYLGLPGRLSDAALCETLAGQGLSPSACAARIQSRFEEHYIWPRSIAYLGALAWLVVGGVKSWLGLDPAEARARREEAMLVCLQAMAARVQGRPALPASPAWVRRDTPNAYQSPIPIPLGA